MAIPSESMASPIDIADIFMSGFTDSVNPCALMTIFWLIVLLTAVGKTYQQVLSRGLHFIFVYFLTSFVITLGMLDFIAVFFNVHAFLKAAQLCVAAAVIVLGGICVRDWWSNLKGRDRGGQLLKYPVIVFDESVPGGASTASKPASFWQSIVFYIWILGVSAAFLASIWPPNYVITQLQGGLYLQGERFVSVLLVLAYEMLYILPLMAVFVVILYAVNAPKVVRCWQDSIGAVKMAMAGMLLGWGFSLIYLFW